MAEIVQGNLSIDPPIGGRVPIILFVEVLFTQREVDEKLNYGLNVMLLRHDPPTVQVFTRRTGMTAMSVAYVPDISLKLPATGKSQMLIQPAGVAPQKVRFDFTVAKAALPAGTQIHAVMTIVPENLRRGELLKFRYYACIQAGGIASVAWMSAAISGVHLSPRISLRSCGLLADRDSVAEIADLSRVPPWLSGCDCAGSPRGLDSRDSALCHPPLPQMRQARQAGATRASEESTV